MKDKTKSKSPPQAALTVLSEEEIAAYALPPTYQLWLQALSQEKPCGDFLEYDADYCMLQTRFAPKGDVQYGEFRQAPASMDWAQLERECQTLMTRTRDITVLIWFARCRARRAGAKGLHEGVALLHAMSRLWSAEIHPQLVIDGVEDPALRANALLALTDAEGLLADLRDLIVNKSASQFLTVRDVERACSTPRAEEAMDLEYVKSMLRDLYQLQHPELLKLAHVHQMLLEIDAWAEAAMPQDNPDLSPLLKITRFFHPTYYQTAAPTAATETLQEGGDEGGAESDSEAVSPIEENAQALGTQSQAAPSTQAEPTTTSAAVRPSEPLQTPLPSSPVKLLNMSPKQAREAIRSQLFEIEQWFTEQEPSSPAALLLKQTRLLIGKPYHEVAHLIPQEMIALWAGQSDA